MNIIFTLLVAFPTGLLIRQRGLAVVAFLAADAFLFVYQTLNVLLDWMSGDDSIAGAKALGEFPTGFPLAVDHGALVGYGVVNLIILLAGVGLTVLGHWVRSRRSTRRTAVTVG